MEDYIMKNDFETQINRSTQGAAKWKLLSKDELENGIIPYSVADMEFKNPPAIVEGLKKHLDENILGYTSPTNNYYAALKSYMKRHHGIEFNEENVVLTPGVVIALYYGVEAFSNEGENVVILSPVYYPFRMVIEQNNRNILESELVYINNQYSINFDDLEKKLALNETKIMIFCSPHNPIGRVWKQDEVARVSELCLKYNVLLISDEIHMDLIMPGYKHFSAACLPEEFQKNLMLCTSCSKTFNLAGLQISNIIFFDSSLKAKFHDLIQKKHIGMLNNLAYKALELAYTECDDWLSELIEVLDKNRLYIKTFIEENLKKVKVIELQGTYLQWLDLNEYNLSNEQLEKLMQAHSLYFDEGYIFGQGGDGFERINIACPHIKIVEAMERLKQALDSVNQ